MFTLVSSLTKFRLVMIVLTILPHRGQSLKARCMNNGTLTVENDKSFCTCLPGFTGKKCEEFPCGEQYDPDSPIFNKRCLCDSGWTGEFCEDPVNDRCGVNGEENRGKCFCHENFVGDRCQYVKKCLHGQLYNGRCACYYGWAGDFCDQIICHQGEPDDTNAACICPAKYRGKYCDFCAAPSSSPPPECEAVPKVDDSLITIDSNRAAIIMVIVTTIVLLVLGASFYFLCYKIGRMKKDHNNTRQVAVAAKQLLENGRETYPLHGNRAEMELAERDSKKILHTTPPPAYETLHEA